MEVIKISEKHRDFFSMVYAVVQQVPEGRVTSYGAIAKYLGMARSSRMVGWAMNAAHHQPFYVPAHRVVNREGLLTGTHHFGSAHRMAELLSNEGVRICNDQVENFNSLFWDPASNLALD